MSDTLDLKAEIGKALKRLHTLRDEIRVRIHLGGMDLKDKWGELETKLSGAEHAAQQLSDAALKELHILGEKFELLGEKLSTSEPLGGGEGMATGKKE